MNILLINGSPKGDRSNTLQLSRAFVAGMGNAQVRQLDGKNLNIRPCLGCFACWNKTPGKCCLNDDMQSVIESLLWADVTVWSFPLYYFSVPGPLKNLIDRQLPMVLPFMKEDADSGGHPARFDMSGKRNVVISTCGFHTAKGNYDGVTALFDHLCGKNGYETIFCGQGELFRVPELKARTGEYLRIVQKAGAEYAGGGISAETRKELETPLYPRDVFEAMADASWGVDKESGEKSDETEVFTRQMAALYNKGAYPGKDIVLEMHYTDVDKTYQILLGKDGVQVRKDHFESFTTRIETPYRVWKAIAAGEISGEEALAQQKYRVKGVFGLMLHWNDYFGGTSKPQQKSAPAARANMMAMLLPWMALWIGAGIDSFYGSIAAIAVCALAPLLYYQNRKTIYDVLSGVLVTFLSAGLLLGADVRILLPAAYLAFGVLWVGSCFTKIPLSAHYSMDEYGGEGALGNSLFMKTNRILSLAWGALYLVTPIWTYIIMGTGLAPYVGAINSIAPLAMGVFTGWFQKWYPAKVARG